MEILSDQAAIDYLTRARSCLHPEKDNFGSIPLLARMLDIERAWVSRMVAKGQTGIPLECADYGLPRLNTFKVDIHTAFNQIERISNSRAYPVDSLLQQMANASVEGVQKSFDDLQKEVEADFELLDTLETFNIEQAQFLTTEWDGNFPLYTEKHLPGVLLSRTDTSPFIEGRVVRKKFNENNFMPGFKFIDGPTPLFLMVAFSPEQQPLGFRVLTPYASLVERSEFVNEDRNYITEDKSFNVQRTLKYYDLANQPESAEEDSFEERFGDTHPAVFRALYQTDLIGRPKEILESYFISLRRLNDLINQTTRFSEDMLEARAISPEESRKLALNMTTEVQEIYAQVPDNELLRVLQNTMAEGIKNSRAKAEQVKGRRDNPISKFLRRGP